MGKMRWSQWKLQVVMLWLGGCLCGSLIKEKSLPVSLASAETLERNERSIDSVKYLHSKVIGVGSPRRDQNLHSTSLSSSSSSSSSSNFVFSSGSDSTSTYPRQQHNHHNSHHRDKVRHSHYDQDSPNHDDHNEENNIDRDHEHDHDQGFASLESDSLREFPNNEALSDSGGGAPIQEKLRSSKGTSSGGMSGSGGSGSSGGSSSSGGIIGGDTRGMDHHHLNTQRQSESDMDSEEESRTHHHFRHQHHYDQQLGYNSFTSPPREQQEKLLLQQLMRGYERDVRPVRNASQSVVVKVGITLTQIFDMDEKNQVLTTNVWLDQEWNDELLRWDPKDFGGIKKIRIPCERIWLPDIVLYNNADDYTRGYMPSRAMVSYDGSVFWPPPTKFRSTCAVDVTYFPFDDQTCQLKLGSWTYNGFEVDVTNGTDEIDLKNYVKNGEWDLLRADINRNVMVYSCCTEPFPDVTITLVIRRKTLYYIYNIVLPCMMLSVLTLLVFCLPPDSGEKIALGITVLLAFSVFMLAISEALPETSESIPLIGIYLTVVMAITSISVIVTVVVLNLHYLGPRVRPVPAWLKCLLPEDDVNFIRQKSLLIPASHREPKSGSLKRGHNVYIPQNQKGSGAGIESSAYNNDDAHPHHLECSSTESVTNERTPTSPNGEGLPPQPQPPPAPSYFLTNTTNTNHSRQRLHHQHQHQHHQNPHHSFEAINAISAGETGAPGSAASSIYPHITRGGTPAANSNPLATSPESAQALAENLVTAVRYLMSIQEQVESQNVLVAEWRLVAQAVDRILFWIFTVMTIISSMVLLLILPLYKRSTYYGPSNGTDMWGAGGFASEMDGEGDGGGNDIDLGASSSSTFSPGEMEVEDGPIQ
ncbi:unnamed protein product [Orchesella dallaii]|uniref:Uncharacterized protein n=1 Tax=Orchesella dallaii TaxID=48710 RepID=A0ABP1RJH5_9HEXA